MQISDAQRDVRTTYLGGSPRSTCFCPHLAGIRRSGYVGVAARRNSRAGLWGHAHLSVDSALAAIARSPRSSAQGPSDERACGSGRFSRPVRFSSCWGRRTASSFLVLSRFSDCRGRTLSAVYFSLWHAAVHRSIRPDDGDRVTAGSVCARGFRGRRMGRGRTAVSVRGYRTQLGALIWRLGAAIGPLAGGLFIGCISIAPTVIRY